MATRSKNPSLNKGNPNLNLENVKFCQICCRNHSGSVDELCVLAKPDKIAKFKISGNNSRGFVKCSDDDNSFNLFGSDDDCTIDRSMASVLGKSKKTCEKEGFWR